MVCVNAKYSPKAKCWPKKPDALFLQYQEDWINDNSRLKCAEKSRQIGYTWCTSFRANDMVAPASSRFDVWVSSRDDEQARLFLEDCKSFGYLFDVVAKDLGEQVYGYEGDGRPIKAYVHEFASGRRIHSMSSNPDAQAGKRGARFLDEFALHKDQRKMWSIAYPGITWGGSLEVFSTHRGTKSFFNTELVEEAKGENRKKISLHTITLERALNEGFLYKLQRKLYDAGLRPGDVGAEILEMDEQEYFDFVRSGCADQESFDEEFMCIPSDDESAFLEYDLITGCEYEQSAKWDASGLDMCLGDLYVGVDIGRKKDLTAIWVLEKYNGIFFTRKLEILKKMKFALQESILYPILAHRNVKRCCIDATGLGMQFAERAQDRFGKFKVESVNFNMSTKSEMAHNLLPHFQDRTVRIPNDKFVRADLRSIKKEIVAGNVRFSADNSSDGHADRFWALALALTAGKSNKEAVLPPAPSNPVTVLRGSSRKMDAA